MRESGLQSVLVAHEQTADKADGVPGKRLQSGEIRTFNASGERLQILCLGTWKLVISESLSSVVGRCAARIHRGFILVISPLSQCNRFAALAAVSKGSSADHGKPFYPD
ncbi:MAG: hypothetical protein Q8J76_08740, partial [Desulfobulbaceae bacterium]|nr:hypothetical protein [Desulfobulbaceae bacterium]